MFLGIKNKIVFIISLFILMVISVGLFWYSNMLEINEIGDFSIIFKVDLIYQSIFLFICYLIFFAPLYISGKTAQRELANAFDENFAYFFKTINKLVAIIIALCLLFILYDDLHLKAMMFFNSQEFNQIEPLSLKDVGYFIFERPFLYRITTLFFISFIASYLYSLFIYFAGFELYFIYLKKLARRKVKYILKRTIGKAKTFKISYANTKFLNKNNNSQACQTNEVQVIEKPKGIKKYLKKLSPTKDVKNFYTQSGLNEVTAGRVFYILKYLFNILLRNYRNIVENERMLKDLTIKFNIIFFVLIIYYHFRSNGIVHSNFWGLSGVGYIAYNYWSVAYKALMGLTFIAILTNIIFIQKNTLKKALKINLWALLLPIASIVFYTIFYLLVSQLGYDNIDNNSRFIKYNIQNTVQAYNIDKFYENENLLLSDEDVIYMSEYFKDKYKRAVEEYRRRDDFITSNDEKSPFEIAQEKMDENIDETNKRTDELFSLLELMLETEDEEQRAELNDKINKKMLETARESQNQSLDIGGYADILDELEPDYKEVFYKRFGNFERILAHKDMADILIKENMFDTSGNNTFYANHIVNPAIVKKEDEKKLMILSPREKLYQNRLSSQYEVQMKDTHGYGVELIDLNGNNIFAHQKQIEASKVENNDISTNINNPRIYYGANINSFAVVGPGIRENDNFNKNYYSHTGESGFQLNYLNRLMALFKTKNISMLLDQSITERTKLLINRNVVQRAKKALPFLTIDENPYMLISDEGRLKWIVDAYTTTNRYPFSNQDVLKNKNGIEINYIRNSVRFIIDAYDGTVNAYVIDDKDPILKAYRSIYPGILQEKSLPEYAKLKSLYPRNLLQIEYKILSVYNKQNREIESFVDYENVKDISDFVLSDRFEDHIYYCLLDLNNDGKKEFATIIPVTLSGRERNNLDKLIVIKTGYENHRNVGVYKFN